MATKLMLNWSDYKSTNESRGVFFPGGFRLYVCKHDLRSVVTKDWQVLWYGAPPIPGLSDRKFRTRLHAQVAAERVFIPIIVIATELFRVKTDLTLDDAVPKWWHANRRDIAGLIKKKRKG